MNKFFGILIVSFCLSVHAQLAVTILPPKVIGQKVIVELRMTNGFPEKVESARAVCFILDDQGKMVGQSTKWVISAMRNRPGLESKKAATFNFVVTSPQPFSTTNLTAKVTFNRLILAGGQAADVDKTVLIKNAK